MEIALSKKFLCACTVQRSLVSSVGIMVLFLITASWFLVSSRSSIFPLSVKVAEDIQNTENTTKMGSGNHGDGQLILDARDIPFAESKKSRKAEAGFTSIPNSSYDKIQSGEDSNSSENSTKTITGKLDSSISIWAPASHNTSSHSRNSGKTKFGDCDLYHGKWIYDPTGPLYTNITCPVLTQSQNCQGNGRPDKDYENWRWKPDQCNIPRFDARKFLEMMKGKILAFIGDSVARNQMESMLCILWQVEAPRMRGNRRMHRWHFRSTSTTIVRIWSSWLVHKSASRGIVRVHLDKPDEAFFELLPMFDVVVLSSGHWFSKGSIYLLNGEIVGSQLKHSDRNPRNHINSMNAYNIATETVLTAIATHPNYTGITILRTYSPDHYNRGSCSNNAEPARKLAGNGHTVMMHDKQVESFKAAVKKVSNGSKLRLMDITEVFGYRHDGHPGRYGNPDAKNLMGRHIGGRRQSEDCLHWCMPGPVDIWNEILFEILKREL
ncbi:hypothetical protein MA16_Dca010096 [Dendrobium catenatum]|uniref:Uncharacterized protein n=1 Tax=Dendrobium catenatum TaxID=906689 RepID=A0A2I0X716_9ASPA|nr:hypothetical protein MA16_Dca010096 [Dendrobium catenatum]